MSAATMQPPLTAGLLGLTGARAVGAWSDAVVRVHTDSRSLQPGDWFVALKGERFDAHDFLPQVAATGAVGVLAERGLAAAGLVGVEVPDTRRALGELATWWRSQHRVPLVAVTGSNGKTTVTQMVATLLKVAQGEHALATEGNLNNDIGVPQTLLRLRAQHRVAVVELGMNHPGEVEGLAAMAQPTVGLVNNAQREHQEFMATVEAVAVENGQVLLALPANGVAVFPSDDAYTSLWRSMAGQRPVLTFSDTDPHADVRAQQVQWHDMAWHFELCTPHGQAPVRLAVAGRHNVRNALAAAACALSVGVTLSQVAEGLARFEPVKGRSKALAVSLGEGQTPLTLVDDTYNANPDSVLAAIEVLAALPAPQVLVLGDMGEVGDQALAFHTEVLQHAQAKGLPVWCTGEHMAQSVAELAARGQSAGVTHVADMEALVPDVLAQLKPGGSVLVKGSRFMRMERVVQAIQAITSTASIKSATAASKGSTHAH